MKTPPTLGTQVFTCYLGKLFSAIIISVLIASAVAVGQAPPNTNLVSPGLFSLSMNAGVVSREPWPVVSFAGVRLSGDVAWGEINTSRGVYSWSELDKWLAAAHKGNQDVLYTFSTVPQWASSDPNNTTCHNGMGTCSPPSDLAANGTGTDQIWKDFVTALATHSKKSTTAHIKYWEMWNEPSNAYFWNGSQAQLLRMVEDARTIIKSIDPTAVVLSPTLTWNTAQALTWDANYLAAGGGKYADAIALHGYVFAISKGVRCDNPEHLLSLMVPFKKMLITYGEGSKPIFNTEASWGVTSIWNYTNADMQAAFVARMYLLHAVYGISRLYWFEWNDITDGTLWLANPTNPSLPGTLLKPGTAYQQVYNWLVGKYIGNACLLDGSMWTCHVSGANGYFAEAIWDTSETCTTAGCQVYQYPIEATKYHHYRTLSGSRVSITGSTVPIGAKPILLENQ